MKLLSVLLISVSMLVGTVQAQELRSRPIKIITNQPVGANSDVLARKVADVLSVKLKTPVLIENRPGAAGLVALQAYLKEPADGYTIYLGDLGNFVTMPLLYKKNDLVAQMKTLAPVWSNYWAVSTPPNIKNITELKSALKNKKSNYGSWGVGTSGHLCGLELAQYFSTDATHIPYKEFSIWFSDIVNGTLTYSCTPVGTTEQYKNSGRLNWVAITADRRDPDHPEVPTIKELTGHQIIANNGWIAFFINKNTPESEQRYLSEKIKETLQVQEIKDFIKFATGKPINMTNEEFDRYREKSIEDYKKTINNFNINTIN